MKICVNLHVFAICMMASRNVKICIKKRYENPEKDMNQEDMGISKNRCTPKSSILIGFSIINHPFWGTDETSTTMRPCAHP